YGRDAADARLLAKTGRFLFYRDSGPTLTFTRLQQVEHEAYLTLRAAQAGARVPEVIEAGRAGPSGDAVLVGRLPGGAMLSAAAARCLSAEVLAGVLRHLRRAGLDPVLVRELRGRKKLLGQVREHAARAASIEVPKLAEPRRISWPTLILIVGTVIGGWALIGVLVDVTQSFDTIIGANWPWVAAAFVLAQLAFAGTAVETLRSVAGQL